MELRLRIETPITAATLMLEATTEAEFICLAEAETSNLKDLLQIPFSVTSYL